MPNDHQWDDLEGFGTNWSNGGREYFRDRFQGCQGFTEPDLSTLRYKIISVKEVIVGNKSIFYSAKNQIICLDLSAKRRFVRLIEVFFRRLIRHQPPFRLPKAPDIQNKILFPLLFPNFFFRLARQKEGKLQVIKFC